MNVRKPVDYGTMHRELTAILAQNLPQMIEIYAIGKAISQRPEKGAAVAAAEFLQANFPDRTGFSPRNVRRMRDFYKAYENDQTLLRLAKKIGWTLNVVIMEAELTKEQRISCLQRVVSEKLSKKKLTNASVGRTEQAQFEPPLRRVAERKIVPVRWSRRKLPLLVARCGPLISGFLRAVYRFPYLQTCLGSS